MFIFKINTLNPLDFLQSICCYLVKLSRIWRNKWCAPGIKELKLYFLQFFQIFETVSKFEIRPLLYKTCAFIETKEILLKIIKKNRKSDFTWKNRCCTMYIEKGNGAVKWFMISCFWSSWFLQEYNFCH